MPLWLGMIKLLNIINWYEQMNGISLQIILYDVQRVSHDSKVCIILYQHMSWKLPLTKRVLHHNAVGFHSGRYLSYFASLRNVSCWGLWIAGCLLHSALEVGANFLWVSQTTLLSANMIYVVLSSWAPTGTVVVQGWDGCESGLKRSVTVDQLDSQH